MSDIRKWFMKQHDKNNGSASKAAKPTAPEKSSVAASQVKPVQAEQESSVRRKTSKYFATEKQKPEVVKEVEEFSAKRKAPKGIDDSSSDVKPPPVKKLHKVEDEDDDDFVPEEVGATPNKKLKSGSGRGVTPKSNVKPAGRGRGGRGASEAEPSGKAMDDDDSGEDIDNEKSASKSAGRGRGRGAATGGGAARGRGGGGRGGFMNFGERKDPPHKGEKEVPEGAPNCLAGLTFVISGTLDSLEREEAEDLIKRHGGRVTGSVSKKTNYLLCDEDIGGRKSAKASELGTPFLTEDGLFDLVRASNKGKSEKVELKKALNEVVASPAKKSPQKVEVNKNQASKASSQTVAPKVPISRPSPAKRKDGGTQESCLPWTEKYRPKVQNDITGNQTLVKQLHDWLTHWNEQFLNTGSKEKGKKQIDTAKKAVLLSGTPGIGKTTSAKVVCKMLGYQAIEVNASDSRGKADAKIQKGVGGSTANSVKELVSNAAFSMSSDHSKQPKSVLIMDEVDGMSAGDRGGVADLIATIKISKIPIICICNDRYSQKLKSLVNYCLLLSFRKPTKTQMAKRLQQIAVAEGIKANEIALEELSERANGDMRMAVNQLQYMSLSMSVINYDDVRHRLLNSAKDEDISPFTAVDKLFGFDGGKLRMDERIDLSMSDPDLVPLLIQENYLNYRPSAAGKDDNGIKRMNLIARAAESIADGDIINVQIRRYRQWQLSQTGTLASCIIPSALLHGKREILEQGERNYNRFGGWLGKNSTMGKNYRLMEDLHIHLLASRESGLGRTILRVDYLSPLVKRLTDPLRALPKDEAVEKVVEFMDSYSISQEDFDTVVELSKFQGRPNPLEGIPAPVKAALTKAYNKGSSSRVIRTADLINLPGIKKAPKKRVAAMLEPADDGLAEEDNADAVVEEGEGNSSDTEDLGDGENGEAKLDLMSLNSKGIQVQVDVKGAGKGSAKKSPAAAGTGRGRGKAAVVAAADKKGGRGSGSGSGSATKRKR